MGQYYRIANLDKRETLDPFKFGSALKLTESCYVGDDYVDAITYLLANDWHGDRVLLCGDYAWSEEGGSAAGRLRVLAESDPFEASEGFLDRSGDFASVRGNEVYREIAPNLYGKVPVDGTFHIDAGHYRYVADETAGVFYDREKAPRRLRRRVGGRALHNAHGPAHAIHGDRQRPRRRRLHRRGRGERRAGGLLGRARHHRV